MSGPAPSAPTAPGGIELKSFRAMDAVADVGTYVQALEEFDLLPQLQELKQLARSGTGLAPGQFVLDVGCGFGLETLRLARIVGPGGRVAGIDQSADFVADAKRRAKAAGLEIDFSVGDAAALPYPEACFDSTRAERLLIYLGDPGGVLAEMARVTRPGGRIAVIEPDFGSVTVGLPNRPLVRRVMAHEADKAVVHSWLPAQLPKLLRSAGYGEPAIATRVVLFSQKLGTDYFSQVGRSAAADDAISPDELSEWLSGIDVAAEAGSLFGSIDYFLFVAALPAV
jgi:SAM-dependent methyltransferase